MKDEKQETTAHEASQPLTIGPHRLLAGDLTTGKVVDLMTGDLADVSYTDPPWGPGLLQMFATQLAPGSAPRLSWPRFLGVLAASLAACTKPGCPIFVEMGWRWVYDLDAAMASHGLDLRRRFPTTYGPARGPCPATLSLYGDCSATIALPDPPHGEAVTRAVLGAVVRPGMVVLDPCTGLGMTARVTHNLGGHFRGLELVPARLEKTATWLRRKVPSP